MPAPKPIAMRGKQFPSVKAAAQFFGLSPSTVAEAVRRGTQDRAGSGRELPCMVRGVVYRSQAEAASSLGVARSTVSWSLDAHDGDLSGLGLRRYGPKPTRVYANGHVYPSVREAAQTIGVAEATVREARRWGRTIRVPK